MHMFTTVITCQKRKKKRLFSAGTRTYTHVHAHMHARARACMCGKTIPASDEVQIKHCT